MSARVLVPSLLLLSLVATAAEQEPGVIQVAMTVGETQTVNVGGAIGVMCDDPSVVASDIKGDKGSNEVIFKALKAGMTLCRAGSDALGFKRMIRVRVSKPGAAPEDVRPPSDR